MLTTLVAAVVALFPGGASSGCCGFTSATTSAHVAWFTPSLANPVWSRNVFWDIVCGVAGCRARSALRDNVSDARLGSVMLVYATLNLPPSRVVTSAGTGGYDGLDLLACPSETHLVGR